ncbi:MAG: hypothetical protein GQ550_03920 [Gammaproteobacteria bacterium]|nr:hypothetical protein [Gammaproteobacteria bacterium]
MITKSIHESGRLVVACFSSVVTMPEIEEYFYWLVENHDSNIKEDFSQLIYSSDLEKVDIQVNDVHRISHLRATVGRNSSGSNLALVVPDLKYYWMARLYQTLSKSTHIKTRLFRDVDDAFTWLGFKNTLTD